MAKFNDDERNLMVIATADYIIKHKCTTRDAAKAMKVSNYTISDWMRRRLIILDPVKYRRVQKIFLANTPKTVTDNGVKKRVLQAAKCVLNGMTVQQIHEETGISIHVIYEDLQTRLRRLDEGLWKTVNSKLKENSLTNLNLGSSMPVNSENRGPNGRFKK